MSDEISLESGPEYAPQKRWLSRFIKGEYPIPTDEERKPYAYNDASLFSKIFFMWVLPILNVGYARTVRPNDLFYLTDDMKIETMVDTFNRHLYERVGRYKRDFELDPKNKGKRFEWPSLTIAKTIITTLKHDFIKATVLGAICLIFMSLTPLLMKQLIRFVELYEVPFSNQRLAPGIGYAIGCSLVLTVTGLLFNHYINSGLLLGIKAKSLLTTVVLEKSFKLSPAGRRKFTTGKITSLMGTDLSRVDFSMMFQPLLITLPISLIIAIVILIINIGVSALIGLAVFVFCVMIIGAGTSKMFSYRNAITKLTDNRVDIIKEVLNNLKMIKFYSWEMPYLSKIIAARSAEINGIFKIQMARNITDALALSLTGVTSMVSFLVLFALKGKTKGAADVFSSVSTFEVLGTCSFLLPMCLATCVDLLNAFKRVERLLMCEETQENENYIHTYRQESKTAIDISYADFSWDTSTIPDTEEEKKEAEKKEKRQAKEVEKLKKQGKYDEKEAEKDRIRKLKAENGGELPVIKDASNFAGLQNINLSIQKGEFVVITGVIGSGKSSMLSAMSGTMGLDAGKVTVNGSYLMCGEPWVQNATIKENIIFGSPFNEELYNQVVYSCSLQQDLNSFDAGDETEVGERGITLSGGQKARINLARAVYSSPDIIFLDDVLSAVDARVGKHIMTNCILGLLDGKTRVLATHQLSLIESADKIMFLNGDGSVDFGTFDELQDRNDGFKTLMSFSHTGTKDEGIEDLVISPFTPGTPVGEPAEAETAEADTAAATYEEKDLVSITEKASRSDYDEDENESIRVPKDLSKGRITKAEEKAVNRIKSSIYVEYVKAGVDKLGLPGFFILFPLACALATFCNLFTNTWLSFWVSHKFPHRSDSFYMGIYAMFTFLTIIFIILEFFILVTMTTKSSKVINLKAVHKLLHAPMSFIDTTPTGRILNRFTKDTDALDNEISQNLRFIFYGIANLIGILVLCCIYLPWILIAVPFFILAFACVADYVQAGTREVKRIEAIQRSFVYNNFSETLNGMATIKAYRSENRFIDKNNTSLNLMNEASFIVITNQRWLSVILELMVFFFSVMITLMCVNRVFKISAASTGLIISYSFSIGNELTQFIRLYTQIENDMNSAERIQSYAYNMQQEAPFEIPDKKPDLSWPQRGEIQFNDVSLRYREALPLVLKNLTFNAAPGEKIGICGRTGAGKSSIMTALFRIAELSEGSISIDGVDISKIGLSDLRSNLSIIPQDPVLFNGTIRKNLDPFNERPDEDIWEALRRAGIIEDDELETVKKQQESNSELHKFHLDQAVEESGSNFSLGERQLISFARALLRDTKILVLDEATSSVDYETDSKIQNTIKREFSNCTILCIAHRLKTIINYDKIMTLEKGTLAEFGTPWSLYNSHGIFRQICEKSSIDETDFLKK